MQKADEWDANIIILLIFVLWGSFNPQLVKGGCVLQKFWYGAGWNSILLFLVFSKIGLAESWVRGKSWATVWILATCNSFISAVEKFIPLLPVSLKDERMLGEFNVLSFLFLVLISGMRSISLCKPSGIKLLSLDPPQAGLCRLVRVED